VIRVHCFVSCLCESLNKVEGVDQRPFYFGVWDAAFFVAEGHRLAYHSPAVDQSFFCRWYEELYGARIEKWYGDALDKRANIERLCALVEDRPASRKVLVMLDLFRLPERENKFNQDPFPHYVMLETTPDSEQWLMSDPDFRWQGVLPKSRILDAVASPAVAGGYFFDESRVRAHTDDAVRRYFEVCFREFDNPFTDAIRRIAVAHLEGRDGVELTGLSAALREIPVLAIRKYAYEHGLAFFFRELGLDRAEFDVLCDEVDELVKAYTTVQFRAMKLAMSGDHGLAEGLFALLDQQDARELRVKHALGGLFRRWCEQPSALRRASPSAWVEVQP
jgi:hypothetical protein